MNGVIAEDVQNRKLSHLLLVHGEPTTGGLPAQQIPVAPCTTMIKRIVAAIISFFRIRNKPLSYSFRIRINRASSCTINSQRGDRRIQATGESPVLPWQEKTKKKTGASPDEAGQMTGRYRHAAGPVTRILSSGLRGRLRSRRIVGLGAASSGPDWRSIRDVLSIARFASALVSRHQSPLVKRLRRDSPYTSRRL